MWVSSAATQAAARLPEPWVAALNAREMAVPGQGPGEDRVADRAALALASPLFTRGPIGQCRINPGLVCPMSKNTRF